MSDPTPRNDFLVWTDIETTGLDRNEDQILEVGFRITNLRFENLAEASWLIWGDKEKEAMDEADPFVKKMHSDSALLPACIEGGNTLDVVQEEVEAWLSAQQLDPAITPLCGSSVQFDRSFFDSKMPGVTDHFSYRNLDVSSLKETVQHYSPLMVGMRERFVVPMKKHRVEPDIEDTINEFRFYVQSFGLA